VNPPPSRVYSFPRKEAPGALRSSTEEAPRRSQLEAAGVDSLAPFDRAIRGPVGLSKSVTQAFDNRTAVTELGNISDGRIWGGCKG
jgi:hypothetical protein